MTQRIAGVDEAGRGCLAGPVFAAAVILHPARIPEGLKDSKQLSARRRAALVPEIQLQAQSWAVAEASVAEIDQLNILQASLLAMRRAIAALTSAPDVVWVDGNQDPRCGLPTTMIVGGDTIAPAIMAASVLAKEARDAHMRALDLQFPGYGLAQHMGYGTAMHRAALQRLGVSPIHRQSFAPCREVLLQGVLWDTP